MLVTYTAVPGILSEYWERGDFFRLMNTESLVTVYFYRQGQEVARAEGVSGGYSEVFGESFDSVKIESQDGQKIQFVIRLGNRVTYDQPPQGRVLITNLTGAFHQVQKTVTNADSVILTANAQRRYLLIQNNAPTGDVFVTLEGSKATVSNGIKIGPGGSLELSNFCPSGEIRAIGSIPSNTGVLVVEG